MNYPPKKSAASARNFITKRKVSRKGSDGRRYIEEYRSSNSSSCSSIHSCSSNSSRGCRCSFCYNRRSSNRIGKHGFSGGWSGPNTKDRDKPHHDDNHKIHQDQDYKHNYDYRDQWGKDHLKHSNKANYQDDHRHYSDYSYDDYSPDDDYYNDFQRYPRCQNHGSEDSCPKPPKNEKKDFSRSVIIVIPEIRKKTDLVKKFQKFQNYWKSNKLPGETKHYPKQMIRKEHSGPKDDKNNNKKSHSRKCFAPNSYVIPTEKPRYNLCWKIRSDMAHGNMPRTI